MTRFMEFQKDIQEGLCYICLCCHRLFFKSSVVGFNLNLLKTKLDAKENGLFIACIKEPIPESFYKNDKVYLCKSCNNYLKQSRKPPLRYYNGLECDNIPEELKLSDLENTLIAKNIIFQKIFLLPKSRWRAVKDRAVNVPITDNDLLRTVSSITSFPRMPD